MCALQEILRIITIIVIIIINNNYNDMWITWRRVKKLQGHGIDLGNMNEISIVDSISRWFCRRINMCNTLWADLTERQIMRSAEHRPIEQRQPTYSWLKTFAFLATRRNPTQLNPTQLNSTQLNSTQGLFWACSPTNLCSPKGVVCRPKCWFVQSKFVQPKT